MLDNDVACHRQTFSFSLFKTTLTVQRRFLSSLSSVLSWCVFLCKHILIRTCSRFRVQYRLFKAFHYYLSVLYISKPCVSVKQSSHSNFILITNHTHSALYLKGTVGVKTQRFIKTTAIGFLPAVATAQPTIWINTVFIVSFRGASMKVMRSFPWPPVSAIEVVPL